MVHHNFVKGLLKIFRDSYFFFNWDPYFGTPSLLGLLYNYMNSYEKIYNILLENELSPEAKSYRRRSRQYQAAREKAKIDPGETTMAPEKYSSDAFRIAPENVRKSADAASLYDAALDRLNRRLKKRGKLRPKRTLTGDQPHDLFLSSPPEKRADKAVAGFKRNLKIRKLGGFQGKGKWPHGGN